MDEFFRYNLDVEDYMPWFEDANSSITNQSAFVKYEYKPNADGISNKGFNIHKRMRAMLTGTGLIPVTGRELSDRERHMISERTRRQKQKQCYLDLQSLLPPKTRTDKFSIVEAAAKKIQELERMKLDLERKNKDIQNKLMNKTEFEEETASIELKVSNPSSGIDYVLEVLQRLKESRSKLKAMKSTISPNELSAILEVQNRIKAGAAVEMAVPRSSIEDERKFHPK